MSDPIPYQSQLDAAVRKYLDARKDADATHANFMRAREKKLLRQLINVVKAEDYRMAGNQVYIDFFKQ